MIILFYQDVVAIIVPNTIKMPAMDTQCFLSNTKANVNYMNLCVHDFPSKKASIEKFSKMIDLYPKLMYKVKIICGDYYYE